MCGENFDFHLPHLLPPGSSPRVRGKRNIGPSKTLKAGLIPACAGKTHSSSLNRFSTRAHPRVCGENSRWSAWATPARGSSPRVRGKLPRESDSTARNRLIPACAGKTRTCGGVPGRKRAHPRVCGENLQVIAHRVELAGSSPRVRGKLPYAGNYSFCPGLIPACAGKTRNLSPRSVHLAAHPRVCGENPSNASPRSFECGSSPRVRGKRVFEYVAGGGQWAHPRVCGENKPGMIHAGVTKGSSPRVRGKLVHEARRRVAAGLIPACAGKTHSPSTPMCSTTAHPRVCGENPMAAARPILAPGSSPRVRGKPACTSSCERSGGLIPACAGKTPSQLVSSSQLTAHPRVCGENATWGWSDVLAMGSSPRVRGKLPDVTENVFNGGLIPACAGKTGLQFVVHFVPTAHPRVCGENLEWLEGVTDMPGSSPRVRGKPYGCRPTYPSPGLIPACAGKTCLHLILRAIRRAHPRVCGENALAAGKQLAADGSSPRVRGKHSYMSTCSADRGLIPACAGKTFRRQLHRRSGAAHPRVCGENPKPGRHSTGLAGSSPRVRGKRARAFPQGLGDGLIPACAGKTLLLR